MRFTFDAELWRWAARSDASWIFVTVPSELSEEIRDLVGDLVRGFGSVRVDARIGGTAFRTSIFPGGDGGAYVLPIKRAVRVAERIELGDTAIVELELVDF